MASTSITLEYPDEIEEKMEATEVQNEPTPERSTLGPNDDNIDETNEKRHSLDIPLTSGAIQEMLTIQQCVLLPPTDDDHPTDGRADSRSSLSFSPAGPWTVRLFHIRKGFMIDATNAISVEMSPMEGDASSNDGETVIGALLSDGGNDTCQAIILKPNESLLDISAEGEQYVSECILSITELAAARFRGSFSHREAAENVYDRYQAPLAPPYIFITDYQVLQIIRRKAGDCAGSEDELHDSENQLEERSSIEEGVAPDDGTATHDRVDDDHSQIIQGGRVASLISFTRLDAKLLRGKELSDLIGGSSTVDEWVRIVDGFLQEHDAVVSLQRQKEAKSFLLLQGGNTGSSSTLEAFQNYTASLKEFDRSQREKQVQIWSTVRDDHATNKILFLEESFIEEATKTKEQVKNQNKETLDYALQCKDEPLCPELLMRWHAWLMGDGLDDGAGSLRSAPMESKTTIYCSPEHVLEYTDDLCDAFERHWLPQVSSGPTRGVGIATFAAAALVGFMDIRPFEAGNERLGRILVNWALRRMGLPFCITLFSDDEGKEMFCGSIQVAKQSLYQLHQVDAHENEATITVAFSQALSPLVAFLLGQISIAVRQFGDLVVEKAMMACEEADARVVRRARECAADGACIICFDDRPNIATLCCGKAVHLNCLAEWLSSHTSCPQCRSELPSLAACRPTLSTGRNAIIGTDDDSVVEHFMSYITNESGDDSSSSSSSSSSNESSSSSSSSSSSTSSVFVYNELHYAIRYATSDDEDDHDDHDDDVSSHREDTENDDEPTLGLDDESISHHYTYEEESATVERGLESVSESTSIGESSRVPSEHSIRHLPGILCENDTYDSENASDPNLRNVNPQETHFLSSSGPFPRLSFLDPALLNNVQNGVRHIPRECDESAFADSSSTDEDGHDESQDIEEISIPAFARPRSMQTSGRPRLIPNMLANDSFPSQRSSTGGQWVATRQYDFSDSEGYESEMTSPTEDEPTRHSPSALRVSQDPPAVCLEQECLHIASRDCCNKRCYSCCVKFGTLICRRHGVGISDAGVTHHFET